MANELGQLSARVSLDKTDFSKNLAAIKREIKTAKTDFDLAGKGVHGFGQDVSSGAAQMKLLERQMGLQSASMKRYKDDYAKASAGMSDDNKATSKTLQDLQNKYAGSQLATAELTEQYKKLYVQTAQGESNFYKTGTALTKFGDKISGVSKKASQFADGWIKVGAVIGVGTGLVLKQAIEWESAVASMAKTIDESDTNPQMFEALTQELRDLSLEIPIAAADLAELAATAGQLGIETPAIAEFTETMAALGVSTNITAEQAATDLARLANITGMSQDSFDNLGSSIVDLGNNFATTEEEIVTMAMRLAGAGSTIGLSEAEILGLSTTLSSLGIEAEAGGSAMSKLMVNMQLATATGGEDLENFAKVAGVSASEFSTAFSEDPMTAIVKFVEGLGKVEESGGSTIETLDAMGITEVRMRDALLRLAGGSDILSEAVNTSTSAWEENTALTVEAEKRYGTTASQLQLLKNEVTDMAIDLGEALLPALLDLVDMARPVIENIKGMITAFTESSDGTKKFVASLLGITVMGGPVLKVFAGLGQGIGGVTKLVGTGMTTFFNYKKGLEATKIASGILTTSTGTLSGTAGLGGLTTSAGLAGTALLPIIGTIAGITAVVALGYGAWKLWGEDAYNASERTKQWGSDIGEEADKALTNFENLSSEASIATTQMAFNIEEGTTKAIESYSGMAEEIKTDIQETISETEEGLASLPESVKKIVAESMTAGVAEQTKLISEIDEIQAGITKVYENALAENRELTDAELVIVENYHSRLAEIRSETLQLSAEEQKQVHAVMTEDLKSFSKEQLRQRTEMLFEETKTIQAGYDEQASLLEEQLTSGVLGREQYNDAMAALNAAEIADLNEIGVEYLKVWEERGDVPVETQKKILADMGLSYDEIVAQLDMVNQKTEQSNRMLAKSSADASEEVRKANDSWNGMILDKKTGEVKTNLDQVITEASESEEGWANLQFVLKNAELDTNAKEKIQDALMANGQWWEMDFPTQFADVETNAGQTAQYYLQANYDWEAMSYEDKMAILNSNSPETLKQALIDTGVWENLSPTEKELIMSTNAGSAAKQALIATGQWDSLSPEEKYMIVTSNSTEKSLKGVQDASNWNGKEWKPKNILVDSNSTTKANAGVSDANKWNNKEWAPKNILVESNASKRAREAQAAINSVKDKTVYITTVHKVVDGALGGEKEFKAAGSNFLKGGATVLGDGGQNEPFMTPDGDFGISPKQDTLYDLPRGTKVWRNIESLMSSLPHFANGTLNQPIKVGDKTFNQLSEALVPFNLPSITNGSEMMRESSSQATNVEGDTYNLYLTANGDLPKATIKKMAKTIQQEIKNTNDRKKFSRGEVVTP